MTSKFKIQKTAGTLFWGNVDEMLKENKESLRSVALHMRDGINDKKTLALYDKLYRYKREAINPPNVLIDGVLNYLKKFDKNLMVSDLYSDWSEYDAEI